MVCCGMLACDEGGYSLLVTFDPEALSRVVDGIEVSLVENCRDQPSGGAGPDGAIKTVSLNRGGRADALGSVEPGSYGIYGIGRSVSTCEVVATGCITADLEAGGEETLTLVLFAVDGPGCEEGTRCVEGACEPVDDTVCYFDSDCDDGTFCNGSERCDSDDPDANRRGCVQGASPCQEDQECDEDSDQCLTQCEVNPDADSDGYDDPDCGGDDCDDSDEAIYPGAPERCNTEDDDCDAMVDEDFELQTNPENCGACGNVCGDANATVTCASGDCVLTCDVGWDDCNEEHSDGCEIDLTTDAANCGECGTTCMFGCESSVCTQPVFTDVVAGGAHACGLEASGMVFCWGANANGQLGDDSTAERIVPGLVTGLEDAVEIAAGGSHTCARRAAGEVVCWGANESGQLGIGSLDPRSLPADVAGLTGPIQLALGMAHSCALLSSGTIMCWGSNEFGQVGDNTGAGMRQAPTDVSGLDDGLYVAAGQDHNCAVRAGGTMSCWGSNQGGQLGDGSSGGEENSPVDVVSAFVAAGVTAGAAHSCAWSSTGAAVCWGCDELGQLGDGAAVLPDSCGCPGGSAGCSLTTTAVLGALVFGELDAGNAHVCARADVGTVSCWGDNGFGQLGDGTTAMGEEPAPASALSAVDAIDSGFDFSCAVEAGQVLCWGHNDHGQLGDGTNDDHGTPAPLADI